MSSLIVLLPSSDVLAPGGWEATPMPFVQLGRNGETLRAGYAQFEALPKAGATVLVVAARDTLLLQAKLPPVTGPKLRRVLPNVVEEYLIGDAQRCHIAVGPLVPGTAEHCVAVIDRDWFAAIVERFVQAGHRRLRAVPLIHCIPSLDMPTLPPISPKPVEIAMPGERAVKVEMETEAAPIDFPPTPPATLDALAEEDRTAPTETTSSALIVRRISIDATPAQAQSPGGEWVELALRQGALGFGMSVNAAQLDATLIELAQRGLLATYALAVECVVEPGFAVDVAPATAALGGEPQQDAERVPSIHVLPLATVVREASTCRFDLCQFEFANAGRSRPGAAGLKPWRIALGFMAASLLVSLVALNVQWLQLRQRRDALNQQMTQLVKTAFPGTSIVLEPQQQMTMELTRLRGVAGELRSDDYLALAAALAHALSPVPSSAIAELNYSGGALEVTFKAGTDIDEDGLKRRLANNGLSAQEDDEKWTLKPAPSGPR